MPQILCEYCHRWHNRDVSCNIGEDIPKTNNQKKKEDFKMEVTWEKHGSKLFYGGVAAIVFIAAICSIWLCAHTYYSNKGVPTGGAEPVMYGGSDSPETIPKWAEDINHKFDEFNNNLNDKNYGEYKGDIHNVGKKIDESHKLNEENAKKLAEIAKAMNDSNPQVVNSEGQLKELVERLCDYTGASHEDALAAISELLHSSRVPVDIGSNDGSETDSGTYNADSSSATNP